MKSTCSVLIIKRLAELSNHQVGLMESRYDMNQLIDFKDDIDIFMNSLSEQSQKEDLALLRNDIEVAKFVDLVNISEIPVLTFVTENQHQVPIIFFQNEEDAWEGYIYRQDQEEHIEDINPYFDKLFTRDSNKVTYFTPFPLTPLLSDKDMKKGETLSPINRLFRLLSVEKRDILYIYFYALIIALISLTLPLGIQAMMDLVSGGVIFNSIVLLIAFVILGVLVAGGLQILQYSLVEVIERRIFVKAAMEFSHRIPKVRTEALANYYAPELMNRFFDVLTLQKGLPKLLIDMTGSLLQIIFGLILLSFYHPFFVFFGVGVIVALTLMVYLTGPNGLRASIIESKYKYKVAHWLEELARTLEVFKMAGHTALPLSKTEYLVNNYLYYRKKHFKVLMVQFANVIGFKTIVTGGLLIIGSFLVIDRQIQLGQFVASEIVIILIINAIEKLISSLSTIFDMLTAVDKIGYVTDLPLERKTGILFPNTINTPLSVKIKNLRYKYPNGNNYALKNVTLEVKSGERICIAGFGSAGKSTFAKILSGLLDSYEGIIALNNISMREISLPSLRDAIASNFSTDNIFDGSFFENIQMGRSNITYDDVLWALENLGLTDLVHALPDGLHTELTAGAKSFSNSILTKITIARCIAEKPKLLILNDFFHFLEKEERLRVLNFLLDRRNPWTLICVSNDPTMLVNCDKIVILKDGEVSEQGTYEELLPKP
ncbi:MAG: ATP-binding cassette domain-containing protein, partial [Thermoflexibacter sp.]|nr:ATP-binding cassette domain-containing protein [Thermoflexibacter sp.]